MPLCIYLSWNRFMYRSYLVKGKCLLLFKVFLWVISVSRKFVKGLGECTRVFHNSHPADVHLEFCIQVRPLYEVFSRFPAGFFPIWFPQFSPTIIYYSRRAISSDRVRLLKSIKRCEKSRSNTRQGTSTHLRVSPANWKQCITHRHTHTYTRTRVHTYTYFC